MCLALSRLKAMMHINHLPLSLTTKHIFMKGSAWDHTFHGRTRALLHMDPPTLS